MADYFEIDFLGVETAKSGDAITLRYSVNGTEGVHVVDGGYLDTGDQIVEHLKTYYGTTVIDHVILTHPDRDHANGLRKVLEQCTVRNLWINRPWIYADQLIDRFQTYESVEALRRKLRSIYDATAILEDIAVEKGIPIDRKSTRLNSSHTVISYAVFCLKKKKKKKYITIERLIDCTLLLWKINYNVFSQKISQYITFIAHIMSIVQDDHMSYRHNMTVT